MFFLRGTEHQVGNHILTKILSNCLLSPEKGHILSISNIVGFYYRNIRIYVKSLLFNLRLFVFDISWLQLFKRNYVSTVEHRGVHMPRGQVESIAKEWTDSHYSRRGK